MTDKVMVAIVVVTVVVAILGIFGIIRDYAINTIGELKYMLREAKKRQEIFYTEEETENIRYLEDKIQNHWGRKLVRENDFSRFDLL